MGALTRTLVGLAQKALKAYGLEIRRLAKAQVAGDAALDVLSLCVHDMMRRLPRGADVFCLEIGANDGATYDPVRPYIEAYRWRGLLVEPQPDAFRKLLENYRGQRQLAFENAAIARQDGEATLYRFADAPDLPADAGLAASFRKDVLETNAAGYSGPIEGVTVPALTFATLLRKHDVRRVDMLQIDTEGFDYQILKMVDFSTLKPTLIHFENNFLTADEMADSVAMLSGHGYRLLNAGIDTIAYRQEVDGHFLSRAEGGRVNAAA